MKHPHKFEAWPFDEATNVAAITTAHVVEDGYPILQVSHDDDDGAWQVLCGTEVDAEDARVACLGCLFERDRSIGQVADLPLGWRATRASVGEEWERTPNVHLDGSPEWFAFLEQAEQYLQNQQDKLQSEFRLGEWERYDYDQDTGLLTFSSDGIPRLIADIDVVGSTSTTSGTWLWSWDNESILDSMKERMKRVRAVGEARGFVRLTDARWAADEADGWELTAAAALLLKAEGAYRSPHDRGALFMILHNVRWA